MRSPAHRRFGSLATVTSAVAHNRYSGPRGALPRYRRFVSEQAPPPQVFGNRFAEAVGPGNIRAGYDLCSCFDYAHAAVPAREVRFHRERQDTSAPGWLHLLALIDEAAADGREVFRPLVEMSPEERRQVITVPPARGRCPRTARILACGGQTRSRRAASAAARPLSGGSARSGCQRRWRRTSCRYW